MSVSLNRRPKLLYLMRILLEKTDNQNQLTLNEVIHELDKYGIKAERKSIYTDFEILRNFGLDIEMKKMNRQVGYYIASRKFELLDLKLLVEAVQSANFITEEKSEELIGKLLSLTSKEQAKALEEIKRID